MDEVRGEGVSCRVGGDVAVCIDRGCIGEDDVDPEGGRELRSGGAMFYSQRAERRREKLYLKNEEYGLVRLPRQAVGGRRETSSPADHDDKRRNLGTNTGRRQGSGRGYGLLGRAI